MKLLGDFIENIEKKSVNINLDNLLIGYNNIRNHIIKVDNNKQVEYVIDKKCDHAGGKLILKGNEAVCPLHGWKLNLNSLTYNDSHVSKKQKDFTLNDNSSITIEDEKINLVNPFLNERKNSSLKFTWINHACVYIEYNGISIITDPWIFGPAFLTGWWLSSPSAKEGIELMNKADYIYISHNHPDHLHSETLSLVEKNKKFIVANFQSKSAELFLNSLGFNNIIVADFKKIFELEGGLQFSIFKSGDFRDDSGIYLNGGGNQMLLTVDSNFLNSNILPSNIDVLMTSFAAGASGFPLSYNNYDDKEKKLILERNIMAIRSLVSEYIKSTKPKYYFPYAGMFVEKSPRDFYVKENNLKNSIIDINDFLSRSESEFIYPDKNINYKLINNHLLKDDNSYTFLPEEDVQMYIENYKKEYIYDEHKIINYLSNSNFINNQILYIIPTDDLFNVDNNEKIIFADFKSQIFKTISKSEIIEKKNNYKCMQIYIRKEIISCIIDNMLPWEDFLIGFQSRIKRFPNNYESQLWYHFTNVYVNKKNIRYSPYCGSCSIVKQNPIWNKRNNYKSN